MKRIRYYDMEKWFKDYAVAVYDHDIKPSRKNYYEFVLIKKEFKKGIVIYKEKCMFGIPENQIKDEWDLRDLIANNIEEYINAFEKNN